MALLLAVVVITGCGGGNGGGTSSAAPVAQDGTLTTPENTTADAILVATDVDSQTLNYSIVSNGSKGTAIINNAATGDYTYTPNPGATGGDSFNFKANDGLSDSNIATITVTITIAINAAPVAQANTLITAEDTAANGTLAATDVDSTALTYSIVSNGNKGMATITNATTGAYTFTPNLNTSGPDSFSFRANDGLSDSNIATIAVTITPVDDAPVAQAGTLTMNEDTATNGILVATDVDGPALSYSIVSNGGKGTAIITNGATGAYTYTPNPGATGSDSFTFMAYDGFSYSNTATITVTINPVDDPPVAQKGTLTTAEDTAGNAVLVATDVDSTTLTYSIVSNGSKGTATITNATTGAYTYTPLPDANGPDTFSFKANDGSSDSNAATIMVTITPVDDAPVAQDGTLTANEDTAKNGMLVATDVDGPALTYSIVSQGSKGTVAITDTSTGAYTYTPNANANGPDTFSFKANDGSSDSNIAIITVTITPIDDAPVAQDGTLTTAEDTAGNDLLAATDVDSPTMTYSIVSQGSKGTVAITDTSTGAYTYTPNANANGPDTFSFKVNDGSSDSNIATITVTITPINDAPVAQDNTLTTAEDTAGDDVLVATDVDSPTLTYSIVDPGSKGTATITDASTGAYTYTPNLNANGSDTFTFKANDSDLLDSNTASVTVTITPVNDPPVAAAGCGTTPQAVTLDVFLSATDPDTSDTLTYSLEADGSGGMGPITTTKGGTVTLLDASTGEYTYLPATGAGNMRGLDSFQYQVTDSGSLTDSATETVIVDQKIMPLGDSITTGETWIGPLASDYLTDLNPAGDLVIGYRKSLFDSLNGAGYTFDFVGSRNHGSTYLSDTDHEGHDGWTAVEIAFGGDGSNANHDPAGKVQSWLDSNPADIILLHAGTNDLLLTDKYDIENILDEIDTWAVNNINPITVFLALIIDQDPIEPYVTTFNTEVQTMVAGRTWVNTTVNIIDQHSALSYPTDLSEDTAVTGRSALHPNDSGYIKMASVWSTALEAVLDKCP